MTLVFEIAAGVVLGVALIWGLRFALAILIALYQERGGGRATALPPMRYWGIFQYRRLTRGEGVFVFILVALVILGTLLAFASWIKG